ncbi:hypothetical protein IKF15_01940 [Candidatus Saccharibacteria bacterium]|nr:hypothetical protein [Candidatus Saccharibacteria bacterium]
MKLHTSRLCAQKSTSATKALRRHRTIHVFHSDVTPIHRIKIRPQSA